jgi:hypothetical protein
MQAPQVAPWRPSAPVYQDLRHPVVIGIFVQVPIELKPTDQTKVFRGESRACHNWGMNELR